MFFKKSEKIEFISTVEGLDDIEECRPKPAKKYIPEWFKQMPSKDGIPTVRQCPSFPDFFSQGYIVPMWVDSKICYNPELQTWEWLNATEAYRWEVHQNSQMIDHVKPNFNGIDGQFIFKALCPWRVITPPGWSVLQLPLFYHFNQKWSILPGVIDTDIHNQINQQVLYHGNGMEVDIKRGEPFALYIPFKRDSKLDLTVRHWNEDDKSFFHKRELNIASKFIGSGVYRQVQRLRDKNE